MVDSWFKKVHFFLFPIFYMIHNSTVAENQRIYIRIHKKKFANKSGVRETWRFPTVDKLWTLFV